MWIFSPYPPPKGEMYRARKEISTLFGAIFQKRTYETTSTLRQNETVGILF